MNVNMANQLSPTEATRPVGTLPAIIANMLGEVEGIEVVSDRLGMELNRLVGPKPTAAPEGRPGQALVGSSVESQMQDIKRRLQEVRETLQRHVDTFGSAV